MRRRFEIEKRGRGKAKGPPRAATALMASLLFVGACGSDRNSSDAGDVVVAAIVDVDLVIVMNDGGSMAENQTILMAALPTFVASLNSVVRGSLQIGVISTDIGTGTHPVPGCVNDAVGDDGLLNPIRFGGTFASHEPWTQAPDTYGRPSDCSDSAEYPAFLSFRSTDGEDQQVHDIRCNVGLWTGGCVIYQPLEAVERALILHDARARDGNSSPNAGFIRDDAVLAILVVSDKEDASVRDCRYAMSSGCSDASDVFDVPASRWASSSINLRFYAYAPPEGAQDPCWPLERYVDPASAASGWFALKPGHPERILFGAIVGVPIAGWRSSAGSIAWDRLLGTARGDSDNYPARDSTTAINGATPEGVVSMRQGDLDPGCLDRVIPACRREGTQSQAGPCSANDQYFAWPARRIVEVARRFDESKLCAGLPCRNGFVASICARDYGPALAEYAGRVASRLTR